MPDPTPESLEPYRRYLTVLASVYLDPRVVVGMKDGFGIWESRSRKRAGRAGYRPRLARRGAGALPPGC